MIDPAAPDRALALTTVPASGRPASPAEQAFHRLAARIEAVRAELAVWQSYDLRFQQRLAGEHAPLRAQLLASQRALARGLDELLDAPARGARLARGERKKLRHLLLQLVTGLLEDGEDSELEALHDKYSDHSHEELGQSQVETAQAMLKDVCGADLGDDHGATRPDERFERARQAMDERPAAARDVGPLLREIYRKLVSALHPDREPDPEVRDRKTGLMQRVNAAYGKDDLLALLGLQLEIEQIDAAHLASVPPQRVAHYNQILREQLAGLEAELARGIAPYRGPLGPAGRGKLIPTLVDRQLTAEIAQLRLTIRSLEAERLALRDPERRAELLRDYRPDRDAAEEDDLEPPFDLVFEPRRRRSRRRR